MQNDAMRCYDDNTDDDDDHENYDVIGGHTYFIYSHITKKKNYNNRNLRS